MKEFFNAFELNDAELDTVVGGYEIYGANGYSVVGNVRNPNDVVVTPGSEDGTPANTQQSATPSVTPQTSTQTSQGSGSSSPLKVLGGLLGGL
ncbi:MAG: hypothetical protein JO202_02595 [Ktedonobacteraceae bacterium]|nr:hypothetical protein [Ktedonobacteraceae bacterium]